MRRATVAMVALLHVGASAMTSRPPSQVTDVIAEQTRQVFPPWERGSGWLGFRMWEHESHEQPRLPDTYHDEWHLVNSPIRGVVTQSSARHRLGITLKDADALFQSRILERHRTDPLDHPQTQAQMQTQPRQFAAHAQTNSLSVDHVDPSADHHPPPTTHPAHASSSTVRSHHTSMWSSLFKPLFRPRKTNTPNPPQSHRP
ncbi:uncharacterized protein UMAG_06221 [Mycosarcoma maydis]|uniref:Secreted protein n=1 Tax=Mycosarcoma maydis TaxID=5270 RepID=A0A0D1CFN1_MYCMD|nr:uncharacterized protein UMAG_06221 [Ustilago maydis 521]KIS65843.1 hypothetical protein UMAG_06221 [Ustilago maydis 521]|eukprot:XP_011392577.1 hypothetical protein UMAG_06221 [Ustilago maydis 521]